MFLWLMRYYIILALLALLVLFAIPFVESPVPPSIDPQSQLAIAAPLEVIVVQNKDDWLDDLERCESSGNPNAVNLVDKDGTASYGPYQFKPETLAVYGVKYGYLLVGTTPEELLQSGRIFERDLQRDVVRGMTIDADVDLTNEFPDCVRKLGMPPA